MLSNAGWRGNWHKVSYTYLYLNVFTLEANWQTHVRSECRIVDSNLLSQILMMPTEDTRHVFCEELMREHLEAIETSIQTGKPKPIIFGRLSEEDADG